MSHFKPSADTLAEKAAREVAEKFYPSDADRQSEAVEKLLRDYHDRGSPTEESEVVRRLVQELPENLVCRDISDPYDWLRDVLVSCAGPFSAETRQESVVNMLRVLGVAHLTPSERLRTLAKRGRMLLAEIGDLALDPVYFRAFLYERLLRGQLDYSNVLDPVFLKIVTMRLYMAAHWSKCGSSVFEVTPDLAAGLLLTETDVGEVHLPFPVFAIRVPAGCVPFFAPKDDGTSCEWADTIWVEELVVGGVRRRMLSVVWRGVCVADFIGEPMREEDEERYVSGDIVSLRAAERLVVNFLLWLETAGGLKANPREEVPKKLLQKRAARGDVWPTEWVFGKKVKVASEIKRAAAEVMLGGSREHAVVGWKVRRRFIVRGHWRNQAHGLGRIERRKVWIEPHWKGPSAAESWSHLYTIGEVPESK